MHWLSNLWFGYAWPSDKGNGPEALMQTIIYAAIAVVLVPAVRRFVKAQFARVHDKLSNGEAELHAKLDRSIALGEHIIKHHPDIPPLPKPRKVPPPAS
jgi:hypothetical protein